MKSKRFKIYQDEAKAHQTTHWDLDYLPAKQLEELMRRDRELVLRQRRSAFETALWHGFVISLGTLAVIAITYLISS